MIDFSSEVYVEKSTTPTATVTNFPPDGSLRMQMAIKSNLTHPQIHLNSLNLMPLIQCF